MDGDEATPARTDGSRDKYRNVNVASIADLKAELYKKQQEYRQQKPKAPGTSAIQARSAPQKPNIWSKKNTGVLQRAAKDFTAKVEEEDALAKSRRALEAKAKLYDELAQSAHVAKRSDDESSGADDDAEGESRYLVDFDRKLDDEWVDYVDSLGRSRRCLRRDLPSLISMDRSLSSTVAVPGSAPTATASKAMDERGTGRASPPALLLPGDADDLTLLSDDMRREMLRQKWEKEEQEAREKNRNVHYANVRFDEIRDHGAGFYEFSKDEAVRAEEMKRLASLRQQTLHDRAHDEKLKQLREEMVHVRLEMKRLQYLCRPGATVGSVPSDETRRKAEQQKIDSLRMEIANTGGAKDKLDLQVQLQLRLEIAGLRSAVFAPRRGALGSRAPLTGAPDIGLSGESQKMHDQMPAGRVDAPSDSTDDSSDEVGPLPADIPLPEDIPLPPSPQPVPDDSVGSREASSADNRADLLKKLQAALLRLTKMQQAQVERLQRSKKRGPDEVTSSSAASTIAAGASASSAPAAADDTFVGPQPRPAGAAGSVREWDVGKPGIPASARSGAAPPPAKKSWKEERREERNNEFAPPSCYRDEQAAAGGTRSHRGGQSSASSVDRSHGGNQPRPTGGAFATASAVPSTDSTRVAEAIHFVQPPSGVQPPSALRPAVAVPTATSATAAGRPLPPADLSHSWAATPSQLGWATPPPPFSSPPFSSPPPQATGIYSFAGPPVTAASDPPPPGTVSADRCWSAADYCRDPQTSYWPSAPAVGVGLNLSIPPPGLPVAPQAAAAAAVRASWQQQQNASAGRSSTMPAPISYWDAAASQPCQPPAAMNAFDCESGGNPAASSVEASVEAVLRSLRGVVQQ